MESAFFSDQPEIELAARLTRAKRTQLGQVFTPFVIAREMAAWVTALRPPTNVLDPALGLGIFLRAFLQNSTQPPPRLTGYEIDADLANQARQLFSKNSFSEVEIHPSKIG